MAKIGSATYLKDELEAQCQNGCTDPPFRVGGTVQRGPRFNISDAETQGHPVKVSAPHKGRSKSSGGIPLDDLLAAHCSGRIQVEPRD